MDFSPILQKPKQARVVEAVLKAARKAGPGTKLPTMQELAKALGVSIATLDVSLQKLESRGVIERRQGSGIYVAPGARQQTIGLVFARNIFTSSGSRFYQMLIEHCEKKASFRDKNFSFFIDLLPGQAKGGDGAFCDDLSEAIAQRRLDGLLIAARHSPARERWLRSHGIPTVTFSSTPAEDTLSSDYRDLIRLAVRELAARGSRRLALIGILPSHSAFFREALRDEGLPHRADWALAPSPDDAYPADTNLHEAAGRAQTERLLSVSGAELPDGLVVTDDIMTRGVCAALVDAGIAPGRDLPIATHANHGSDALRAWEERLILVEFDPDELMARGFDLLESRMEGAPPSGPIIIYPKVRSSAAVALPALSTSIP